jgi:hypothetical protein
MPKKTVSEQSDVVSAGEPPIDKPVKASKKAKGPVEQVVDKAIDDVEKVVDKVLKRAAKKPAAKKAVPAPPAPPVVEPPIERPDASTADSVGESLMTDVVFRLQVHPDVRDVVLVGDFNGWSQISHPMRRDGADFVVTMPLERGRRYRYRYLVDELHWENDWNADDYVPNDYGGDDSVRIV